MSATAILVFWAAFFSALYTRNLVFKEEDPSITRLARLAGGRHRAEPDILLVKKNSAASTRMKQQLALSGLHRKSDLEHALRLRRLFMLIPFGITIVLFFMGFPAMHVAAAGVLFSVIFIVVPRIWFIKRILKRRREIERHLPDTLDLLILCLEAGLAFDAALVRVAEEQRRVSKQISREFIFTNQEILAGKTRDEALKNLGWRTGVEDMKNMVSAVQQSIKLGTSLIKTLKMQAEVIRKKRRERLRAMILKTPVKLIFPLLFFIFPTLLIVILGPSLVSIFRQFTLAGY